MTDVKKGMNSVVFEHSNLVFYTQSTSMVVSG